MAVVLLAGIAVLAGPILAADDAPAGRRGRPRLTRKDRTKAMVDRIVARLKLTGDKEAQFRQAMDTYAQAQANWYRENAAKIKALGEAFKKATKAGDKEAIQAARKDRAELFKARGELYQTLMKQLADFLTPEQVAQVKNTMQPGPRVRILGSLRRAGLTDEQRAAVAKILKDAQAAADKAEDAKAAATIWKQAVAKIHKDVLTDEQRAAAKARGRRAGRRGRGGRMFAGLDLTEEQQTAITAILAEAQAKAKDAEDRTGRRAIFMAAHKKIREEVLTDAQRKKMREQWQKRRSGGGGRRRGRRDGKEGGTDGK